MIKAVDIGVGREGYQYEAEPTLNIRSVKVYNMSAFNSLDVYAGPPPSVSERAFGSVRRRHRIYPGGWLILPLGRPDFSLGVDGYLVGDDASSNPYAESVPCRIEEYENVLAYQNYEPEELTIASWSGKAITSHTPILFSELDPTFRVPQADRTIALHIASVNDVQTSLLLNLVGGFGIDTIRAGHPFASVGDFNARDIRLLFDKPDRLLDLFFTPITVNDNLLSGSLKYIKRPTRRQESKVIYSYYSTSDNIELFDIPTRHVSRLKIRVRNDHVSQDSLLSVIHGGRPESVAIAHNTDNSVEVVPLSDLVTISHNTYGGASFIEVRADYDYRF